MTFTELSDIIKNGKLSNYYITIKRKVELVNNTWVLKFKKHFSSTCLLQHTTYAYCAHNMCKIFIIGLPHMPTHVKGRVFSSSLNFNYSLNDKYTAFVRKTERILLGQRLSS